MCILFKGKVYSVGDGFCYEGLIKENSYHFVIDCGSKPATHKKKQDN